MRSHRPQGTQPTASSTEMAHDRIGSELASQDESRNVHRASHIDKTAPSQSRALLYYPEENHIPSEQACNTFNSRIMKHLMKQKMQKNDTFYVSKVLKGDNNFLRRQNTGKSPLTANRVPVRSS